MFNMNFLLGSFALPEGHAYAFLNPILDFIESALLPIIIVLLAIASIYAIILGVNMAKAESAEKRDEAKKRIMNFIIGAVVIIVILFVVFILAKNLNAILGLTGADLQ